MSQKPTFSTLTKALIFGGTAFSVISYLMQQKLEKKLKNSLAYQEAVKLLQSEEFPKKFLGEPIVEGTLSVINTDCYGNEGSMKWIKLPVKGSEESGYLKYWFSDDDGSHKLLLIELLDESSENILFTKKTM